MTEEKNKKSLSSWGEPPHFCSVCGKPGHWSGWELHGPQALCWWHDLLQFTDTLSYLFLAFLLTIVLTIVPFIGFWIKVSVLNNSSEAKLAFDHNSNYQKKLRNSNSAKKNCKFSV